MKRQISFKQMHKNTDGLEERVHGEAVKLEKYFDGEAELKWTCSKHGNFFDVDVQCIAANFNKHASARSESFDKSCELVVKKMEKQLKRYRELYANKMHRKFKNPEILDPEQAWADYDEDYFQDVG